MGEIARYRIGIINDFTSTITVADFQQWGIMLLFEAFEIQTEHRGHQVAADAIHVFLNFDKRMKTVCKAEARAQVMKLIEGSPPQSRKDFLNSTCLLLSHLES